MRHFLSKLACLLFVGSAAVPALAAPGHFVNLPVSTGTQAGAPARCVIAAGPLVSVTTLAFSPDGKTLAVGGYKEVVLWDLINTTRRKPLGEGQLSETVRALAFHPNGRLLAVGDGLPGRSGAVRIFNLDTGETVARWDGAKDVIDALAFSPDGKLLAAGGFDSAVRIWEVETQKPLPPLDAHQGPVLGVAFSADGAWLATTSADSSARLWEVKTWKSVSRMQQAGSVNSGAFVGLGSESIALAVGGETEQGVRLRSVDYPEPTPEPGKPATGKAKKDDTNTNGKLLNTGGATPLMVLWSKPGGRLYAACSDKTIKVFTLPNENPVATLTGHDDWVYCLALSPDGNTLASGGADGTVKLWSTVENRLMATLLEIPPQSSQWLILSPRGPFTTSAPETMEWKAADAKPANAVAVSSLQNPTAVQQALKAPEAQKPKPPKAAGAPKPAASPQPTASTKPAAPTQPAASPKPATSPQPAASPKPTAVPPTAASPKP